jgi:hypothetical protein
MGYWKRIQAQQDEQQEAALALALRAGVLKECPVCGDVVDWDKTGDLEPAYRLGNTLITRGG